MDLQAFDFGTYPLNEVLAVQICSLQAPRRHAADLVNRSPGFGSVVG